jgi:predicted nucleotidyltransferase
VSLRGAAHRSAIGAVLDVFREHAQYFVFAGSSVLGLYARPHGTPLRATKDVDCISTRAPWILQEKVLADLCAQGLLTPDKDVQCRYRIRDADIDVDVLSPDGFNVGAVNPWFKRACDRAQAYPLGDGRQVNAISPPYFLATKLVAFADRGPDAQSSKDAEDIVTLAVEVANLAAQVEAEGLAPEIAALWQRTILMRRVGDIRDLVEWHLGRDDREHLDRVASMLVRLSSR